MGTSIKGVRHFLGQDTPLKYFLNREVMRYQCGYCGHQTQTIHGQMLHTKRQIRLENEVKGGR